MFLKIFFFFSRGNACVKSGVSLNELILATYMKEQSLIAQRIFHEGVSKKVVSEVGICSVI